MPTPRAWGYIPNKRQPLTWVDPWPKNNDSFEYRGQTVHLPAMKPLLKTGGKHPIWLHFQLGSWMYFTLDDIKISIWYLSRFMSGIKSFPFSCLISNVGMSSISTNVGNGALGLYFWSSIIKMARGYPLRISFFLSSQWLLVIATTSLPLDLMILAQSVFEIVQIYHLHNHNDIFSIQSKIRKIYRSAYFANARLFTFSFLSKKYDMVGTNLLELKFLPKFLWNEHSLKLEFTDITKTSP